MSNTRFQHKGFWVGHGVWALAWLGLSIGLLSLPQTGHPPIGVFVMFTVPAGVVGHVLLLLIAFIKIRGDRLKTGQTGLPAGKWPWFLVILAGYFVVSSIYSGYWLMIRDIHLLDSTPERQLFAVQMLLLFVLKLACLFGLLLRQAWAKWLIIGLCVFWIGSALYVSYHYWVHYPAFSLLMLRRPFLYILISVAVILVLLRSREVKLFFGNSRQREPAASQ